MVDIRRVRVPHTFIPGITQKKEKIKNNITKLKNIEYIPVVVVFTVCYRV